MGQHLLYIRAHCAQLAQDNQQKVAFNRSFVHFIDNYVRHTLEQFITFQAAQKNTLNKSTLERGWGEHHLGLTFLQWCRIGGYSTRMFDSPVGFGIPQVSLCSLLSLSCRPFPAILFVRWKWQRFAVAKGSMLGYCILGLNDLATHT